MTLGCGRRSGGLALSLALIVSAAGCGGGEQVFSPEGFVDAINAEGAAATLGPVIATNQDGVEVRSVTLTSSASNGTVLVLADSEEAASEIQRCESALSLICFRAANAVLRFEDMLPADQARITEAIQALATE